MLTNHCEHSNTLHEQLGKQKHKCSHKFHRSIVTQIHTEAIQFPPQQL